MVYQGNAVSLTKTTYENSGDELNETLWHVVSEKALTWRRKEMGAESGA